MSHGPASPARLSQGEQRALASFLAGRLPAGQLHDALSRAREAALTGAARGLTVHPVALGQLVDVLGHQRGVASLGSRVRVSFLGQGSPPGRRVYYDGCRTITNSSITLVQR